MNAKTLRGLGALALAGAVVLAGCANPASDPTPPPTSPPPTSEAPAVEAETFTPGKLTIATGEPAYEPWVVGDAPESGEGFEAAIAFAVAEELGFAAEDVVWVRTTFDAAIAPGPKDWDFNLQQFSITDERKEFVDFSSPYYVTTQAVVTVEGSPAATATTLDGLKATKVGVATGTTSYTIAAANLGEGALSVFNNNDDAVLALQSGQIDALVVDLPTAFFISAVQLENGLVTGQFENSEGGDEFGLVLAKGSPLTAPVTAAVDALRDNGTLASIEQQWLSVAVAVPVLQ